MGGVPSIGCGSAPTQRNEDAALLRFADNFFAAALVVAPWLKAPALPDLRARGEADRLGRLLLRGHGHAHDGRRPARHHRIKAQGGPTSRLPQEEVRAVRGDLQEVLQVNK